MPLYLFSLFLNTSGITSWTERIQRLLLFAMDKYLIIGNYSVRRIQANMASFRPDSHQRISCHLDTILFFQEWILFNLEPYPHTPKLLLNVITNHPALSTNLLCIIRLKKRYCPSIKFISPYLYYFLFICIAVLEWEKYLNTPYYYRKLVILHKYLQIFKIWNRFGVDLE